MYYWKGLAICILYHEDFKTQKYPRLRKKDIIIRKPISNEELLKKVDEAINTIR